MDPIFYAALVGFVAGLIVGILGMLTAMNWWD